MVASIGCSWFGIGLLFQNHYPRSTGALSYPFSTPRHSSFRWIGAKNAEIRPTITAGTHKRPESLISTKLDGVSHANIREGAAKKAIQATVTEVMKTYETAFLIISVDLDARAVALLGRLQADHPDLFSQTHLRTLQRRVQQWRGIMANKLVYAASEATLPNPSGIPDTALAAGDPKC